MTNELYSIAIAFVICITNKNFIKTSRIILFIFSYLYIKMESEQDILAL